jgi:hypothetical protein
VQRAVRDSSRIRACVRAAAFRILSPMDRQFVTDGLRIMAVGARPAIRREMEAGGTGCPRPSCHPFMNLHTVSFRVSCRGYAKPRLLRAERARDGVNCEERQHRPRHDGFARSSNMWRHVWELAVSCLRQARRKAGRLFGRCEHASVKGPEFTCGPSRQSAALRYHRLGFVP